MDRLKLMAAIWLSGLIAGLVIVERWRRMGQPLVAAAAPEAAASTTADTSVSAKAQQAATHVGAGAKADVEKVRHHVHHLLHRGKGTPS